MDVIKTCKKSAIYCSSNIQGDTINILWKSNTWHEWLSQILPNTFQPITMLNRLHLNQKLIPKIGPSTAVSVKVHSLSKFSTVTLQFFLSIKYILTKKLICCAWAFHYSTEANICSTHSPLKSKLNKTMTKKMT